MIRAGKFHLALLIGGHDPRLDWIASHCGHLWSRWRNLGALHLCTQ
jgi:hypothetical protein